MARYEIRDLPGTSEGERFAAGQRLLDWIGRGKDFPLAQAHAINRASWSDTASERFERYDIAAPTGGIQCFFAGAPARVEGPLLDLACAGGHNLAFLEKQGVAPLYGVDISRPLLQLARKRVRSARVQQADMVALPFPSRFFKTVIARGALHNTTTTGFVRTLMEIHRVLRDDGIVFLRRRFRPAEEQSYTRVSLHTYLRVGRDGAPEVVRNYMPPGVLKSLIEAVGFDLTGDPPMTAVVKRRNPVKAGEEGHAHRRRSRAAGEPAQEKRFSVECICAKRSFS